MKRKAVWIGCILTALFCGRSADATIIITVEQVGPNVVATGRGTVDYTDLTFENLSFSLPAIEPIFGFLSLGTLDSRGFIPGDRSARSALSLASPNSHERVLAASSAKFGGGFGLSWIR